MSCGEVDRDPARLHIAYYEDRLHVAFYVTSQLDFVYDIDKVSKNDRL
jgi:hypothetical protein